MRLVPIAGAIAAIAGAIAGRPASADGIGVIAAGDDRAAVAAALVDAIRASGAPRVVGDTVAEARAALAAGAVPAPVLARFRQVQAMSDDAWRAFLRVQIDAAQRGLAAARREAEALVALPGGAELCATAALRLGAVLLYRKLPEATASFALARALDPDRPITLAEFSPDVVAAIEAVRAAPAPLSSVRVSVRPAGAIVSIDGRELGAAPLDAPVPRGPHLIVARAPLHRPVVQAAVVDAPAAVELALDTDETAVQLAGGAEPGLTAPAEQALVDAAVAFADVDAVVVVAVTDRRGGPALIAQRCGGAPARCTATAELGFGDRAGLAAAAREAWRAVQGGALREPPRLIGDLPRRPPPPSGCRWCRSPLVWAGAGAAVVTAVIVLAATSGSRPPPIVTIDGHGFGR